METAPLLALCPCPLPYHASFISRDSFSASGFCSRPILDRKRECPNSERRHPRLPVLGREAVKKTGGQAGCLRSSRRRVAKIEFVGSRDSTTRRLIDLALRAVP